jgi:hypothetical protein
MKPNPTQRPNIYVVESDTRAIVAYEAGSSSEARELTRELWFLLELANRKSKGLPLWDGNSRLRVRLATGAEADVLSKALGDRPALPDDVVLVYLVDVDDRRSDSKLVARGDFHLTH